VNRIAGINKEYSNLVIIPVPINLLEGLMFIRTNTDEPEKQKDLSSAVIGLRRGTKFAEQYPRDLTGNWSQATNNCFYC